MSRRRLASLLVLASALASAPAAGQTPDAPPAPDVPPVPVEAGDGTTDTDGAPSGSELESDAEALEDAETFEEDDDLLEAALEAQRELEERDDDELRLGPVTVELGQLDVFREGGSVSVLDETEMRRLRQDDPTAVLQRVPGVYVRSEDGYGLRPNVGLRGTNPERSSRVTLMEDGVLFGPAPYSAPAAYYFPLMLRMTGVDVFRGPSAILFGPSTVAGAIDFHSREIPRVASGQIDLGYGMYRTRRGHFWYGARNAWGGFLVEGVDLATDGFKNIDFAPDDTGFHRGEYVARGFLQTDEDAHRYHRVELRLGTGFEDSHETYLGISDADFRESPYRRYVASALDRMRWRRFETRLSHHYALGDDLTIDTVAYRHDLERVWRRMDGFANGPSFSEVLSAPDVATNVPWYRVLTGQEASSADPLMRTADTLMQAWNDRTFVSQGVQSRLVFHRRGERATHDLEIGLRLHYDTIRRRHTMHGYRVERPLLGDDPEAVSLVSDGFAPVLGTSNRGRALAFAGYASYAVEWKKLRVLPGIRTEVIRTEMHDFLADESLTNWQAVVLPGLGMQYTIRPWLGAFAGVHRGFSPVAPGQAASVDPESTISYELGARVRDDERDLYVEVSGFFNDYRNLLLVCGGAGSCPANALDQQFNAGSANVGGLEALYSHRLDVGGGFRVPLRVSYTLTYARFRDVDPDIGSPGYEDARDGDDLPYIPRHQGQLQAGLEGHGFEVNARLGATSRIRENATSVPGQAMRTDRVFMLDVGGSYAVTERVRLYVRGENLTNQQPLGSRRPFGARPVRPLTALVGLEVALGQVGAGSSAEAAEPRESPAPESDDTSSGGESTQPAGEDAAPRPEPTSDPGSEPTSAE